MKAPVIDIQTGKETVRRARRKRRGAVDANDRDLISQTLAAMGGCESWIRCIEREARAVELAGQEAEKAAAAVRLRADGFRVHICGVYISLRENYGDVIESFGCNNSKLDEAVRKCLVRPVPTRRGI